MDFAKIKQDVYALFMRDNLLEGFSRTFRDEDDPNNFIAVTCERNGLLLNMYISFNGSRIIRRNVFGCFRLFLAAGYIFQKWYLYTGRTRRLGILCVL